MLNLYTDHHFNIGHAHVNSGKPCQDYAISGVRDDMAYAISSDGCSTGGNTDVGARLVALSTKVALCESWAVSRDLLNVQRPSEIALQQRIILSGVSVAMGLSRDDLLATNSYACLSGEGGFVHVRGDGVVAIKYSDGTIIASKFYWDDNVPFYPAYADDNYASFIERHGGDTTKPRFTQEVWSIDSSGQAISQLEERYSVQAGIRGFVIHIANPEEEGVAFVAVFSDGVDQIENVDWKDAVFRLMSFKSLSGEFVKRRLNKELKNLRKDGKGPIDDISYSVIRVEIQDQETEDVGT